MMIDCFKNVGYEHPMGERITDYIINAIVKAISPKVRCPSSINKYYASGVILM